MVPLYNVICSVTGLSGKTNGVPAKVSNQLDVTREVVVELTSTVMPGLGWNFHPEIPKLVVHPGEVQTVNFIAKNVTNEEVAGQAIPSISPGQATPYFKKIECFCFQRQALAPGEMKRMPLRFYVSPDVPKDIRVITLSYAFFNAVKLEKKP